MSEDNPQIVIGCRWVSEPGDCKICNALDGKEFYYHPRDGQTSVKEMPQRRPHPNCRCHTEPIYGRDEILEQMRKRDVKLGEWGQAIPETIEEKRERWKREYPSFNAAAPKIFEGAENILGLFFYSDGRGLSDGPAYGLYCGRNWTDGENTPGYQGVDDALDEIDQACKMHDKAYNECVNSPDREEQECIANKRLVEQLERAPVSEKNSVGTWKNEKELEYAANYRSKAIFLFKAKIIEYETRNQESEQGSRTSGE